MSHAHRILLYTTILLLAVVSPTPGRGTPLAAGASGDHASVTLVPGPMPQEHSVIYTTDQGFCNAIARARHILPQQPCLMMLKVHVGVPTSAPPAGTASPNTAGWIYGTNWVEACSFNDGNPTCYTWNDTITCSWGADGLEVSEQSCSDAPHTAGGIGWSLRDTGSNAWYGCSPSMQSIQGGTISCGANYVVCAAFGNCMNGWMRMAIDTYGNVTGPTGGCSPPSSGWGCQNYIG